MKQVTLEEFEKAILEPAMIKLYVAMGDRARREHQEGTGPDIDIPHATENAQ